MIFLSLLLFLYNTRVVWYKGENYFYMSQKVSTTETQRTVAEVHDKKFVNKNQLIRPKPRKNKFVRKAA